MNISHIVFYGTLRLTHETVMHESMAKSLRLVGSCLIPGLLYNMGRYPALKPGNRPIAGELYEIIDTAILAELDQYEAIDNENPLAPGFSRQRVDLLEPKLIVWVYYYNGEPEHTTLIESNQW